MSRLPLVGRKPSMEFGLFLVLVLLFVAFTAPPLGGVPPLDLRGAPGPSHALPSGATTSKASISSPSIPSVIPTAKGKFFSNNSTFSNATPTNPACWPDYYFIPYGNEYCMTGGVDPSVLHLGNGNVGVGYAIYTNRTPTWCPGGNNTTSQIAFSISKDNGATFGPIHFIGNRTCAYLNAMEPSFAINPKGEVFGAFIESNATNNTGNGSAMPELVYGVRAGDGIGFVTSTDNGTTFSAVRTLSIAGPLGNLSRPTITTFGDSVYIVYTLLNNSTTPLLTSFYTGTTSYPTAVESIYSSDLGATWHGPYALPGENASAGYTAKSPSIAVNSTGTVAVAYATNYTCLFYFFGFCDAYGDDIVLATSTSNGSTWTGPMLVHSGVGESFYYYGGGTYPLSEIPWQWQWTPHTSIAFNASGDRLYVAWDGSYQSGGATSSCRFISVFGGFYQFSGIFVATSSNRGLSWTSQAITRPNPPTSYDYYYTPALALAPSGAVYLTYTYWNDTYYFGSTSPFALSYSQWLTWSSNGTSWASPVLVELKGLNFGYGGDSYPGYRASIAFTGTGAPLVGFVLNRPDIFGGFGNPRFCRGFCEVDPVLLSLARGYTGPTVALTFQPNGLPAGRHATVAVNGNAFSVSSAGLNVTNVPENVSVTVAPTGPPIPVGFWKVDSPTLYQSGALLPLPVYQPYPNSTLIYVNLTLEYGVALNVSPYYWGWAFSGYAYVYTFYSGTYFNAGTFPCGGMTGNPPFPWYFPAGTSVTLSGYTGPVPLGGWVGNGTGSYSGPGIASPFANTATITVNGPINETLVVDLFHTLGNVTFTPLGLPGTSTYSFQFNGSTFTAGGTSPVTVRAVHAGSHDVSNIWATSTVAGWEYFGYPSPANPIVVPITNSVNFTFAFENVSVAPGPVTFHSLGLTAGTEWKLAFNGTTYTSSTPWINVTARPGNYSLSGFPVVAQNASATYAPLGVGPTISVVPDSTYDVTFLPAFLVNVVASVGGSISPSGGYVAAGSNQHFLATASTNYRFLGWTGTGAGAYSGPSAWANFTANGPITETANFAPLPVARFNLTFQETGIPAGTWWSVYLNGVGYATDQTSLMIPNLYPANAPGGRGTYNLTVPMAYANGTGTSRYLVHAPPRTVSTNGATVVSLTFNPQYFLTLEATQGGSIEAVVGLAAYTRSVWVPGGANVLLSATNGTGYSFVGWQGTGTGSYSGTLSSTPIAMVGPIGETAVFEPIPPKIPPRYWVAFVSATPFGAGTSWSLSLNGTSYSSTTATINVTGLLAANSSSLSVNVAYAPDGLTKYIPSSPPPTISVSGNATYHLGFQVFFYVQLGASTGGTVAPASGFFASGHLVKLVATPGAGYVFSGWSGNGSSAYTGPSAVDNITSLSGPIRELASFTSISATQSSVSPSPWSNPGLLAGLAIAGLVVGLVAGVVVARSRAGRSGGEEPPAEASEPTEPGEGPPPGGAP